MHASIERRLKYRDINVPADYVAACSKARKHPKPYTVKYLDHTFFKDYSEAVVYKSIRPGTSAGDPKVTDIRSLKYSEDCIFYKLSFDHDYAQLPVRKMRKKKQVEDVIFPILYKERLKINKAKYNHLQELKMTLHPDYHLFYDSLPHY